MRLAVALLALLGPALAGADPRSPTSPGCSIGTPAALTDSDRAWALTVMADLAANPGEVRLARGPTRPSRSFRELGDPPGLCAALLARAYVHRDEGALDLADSLLAEAQAIAERLDDEPLLGRAAMTAWAIAERRGSDQAERLARQELARFRSLGSRRQSVTAMRHLAVTLRAQGDLDEATRLCESVLADWEELGERPAVARAQTTLADIARERGDRDRAAVLYGRALTDLRAVGDRRCTASTYRNLAVLASTAGEHDRQHPAAPRRDRAPLRAGRLRRAGRVLHRAGRRTLRTRGLDEAAVLLAAADERRRVSATAPTGEEVATIARVQGRLSARAAGPPRPRLPSLEEIVGPGAAVRGRRSLKGVVVPSGARRVRAGGGHAQLSWGTAPGRGAARRVAMCKGSACRAPARRAGPTPPQSSCPSGHSGSSRAVSRALTGEQAHPVAERAVVLGVRHLRRVVVSTYGVRSQ